MGANGKSTDGSKEHLYTIHDVTTRLGPVEEAVKRPTPKQLRETAGEPVLKSQDGRITVYSNGYAVYSDDAGATVLWVPDCRSFTYRFNRLDEGEKKYQREEEEIPEDMFLELPWEVALNLFGLYRVEYNMEMRIWAKVNMLTKVDGDDTQEENDESLNRRGYRWSDEQLGGNPETEYIRRETQWEWLDRLMDKQREVFVLYFHDGLTQREIADELSITQQSVTERLAGALKKLKKQC